MDNQTAQRLYEALGYAATRLPPLSPAVFVSRAYSRPVPRAPVWLLPCLALACATAPPPLPAGVPAEPAVGDSLDLLLMKLRHAEGAPAEIELRELRVVAVERQPWRHARSRSRRPEPVPVGVIAGRRCQLARGTAPPTRDRAPGSCSRPANAARLRPPGLRLGCASHPAFEPASAREVALERALVRYLSQRWPVTEIPGDERLARGLRLLERGRFEDAEYELFALDRRLRELARRQSEYETPDPGERERLRREEEELRPLRAQLQHALRDSVPKEEELP